MKIREIINFLDDNLKLSEQEDWDNSGLQIGDYEMLVNGVVLALDLSEEVLDYAIKEKANLIITHHPFLFSKLKYIDFSTLQGKMISELIKNDISVISLHTSLDGAIYGMTQELAEKLAIKEYTVLHQFYTDELNNIFGFGGIGDIQSISIKEYANTIKKNLNCDIVKVYCNDLSNNISKVAFCGGSGAEFIEDAIAKSADIYVTGDIKYHDAQYALNNGLSIIDAGHFHTENNIFLDKIYDILSNKIYDNLSFKVNNLKKYIKNTVPEHII